DPRCAEDGHTGSRCEEDDSCELTCKENIQNEERPSTSTPLESSHFASGQKVGRRPVLGFYPTDAPAFGAGAACAGRTKTAAPHPSSPFCMLRGLVALGRKRPATS